MSETGERAPRLLLPAERRAARTAMAYYVIDCAKGAEPRLSDGLTESVLVEWIKLPHESGRLAVATMGKLFEYAEVTYDSSKPANSMRPLFRSFQGQHNQSSPTRPFGQVSSRLQAVGIIVNTAPVLLNRLQTGEIDIKEHIPYFRDDGLDFLTGYCEALFADYQPPRRS